MGTPRIPHILNIAVVEKHCPTPLPILWLNREQILQDNFHHQQSQVLKNKHPNLYSRVVKVCLKVTQDKFQIRTISAKLLEDKESYKMV